jgi:phosphohistidine phosphatase
MDGRGSEIVVGGKRVWVIRHAKSSWEDVSLDDKQRPLKKRGKKDARLMAQHLLLARVKFDAVLSSPAKRAQTTCKIITKALGFKFENVGIRKKLYFCGDKAILQCLQELDNSVACVAIFGHNPDFDDFLKRCGSKEAEFPTCGCACVDFWAPEWSSASFDNAKIVTFTTPKMLKSIKAKDYLYSVFLPFHGHLHNTHNKGPCGGGFFCRSIFHLSIHAE